MGIIGLALFGFIATDFTRQCETSSNQARQQVGKVMGEKLSIQDLQQRSEEYKNLLKVLGGDANEEVLREQAWNDFVTYTILEEETGKLGIGVTEEEVRAVLAQGTHPALPRQFMMREFFNEAGEFDYNNVAQIYNALQQQSPEQFHEFKAYWEMIEKMLRRNLLQQKYMTLLQACMLSNEYSAKIDFEGNNTESEVAVAALTFASINDNEVQVTDADLKAKYEEMKEMFKWNDETRDIKYVVCNVVPSDADMDNLTNGLLEAAEQFKADSASIADIVAMHRSTISYYADRPYNKNGIRNISAALLDSLNNMKDSTVTAPFRYMTMQNGKPIEHMAVARLNRRYQDVDSIGYKFLSVMGTSFEDAEQRADSIIGVVKSGISLDSVASSMGRTVQNDWLCADTYQGKENLDADTRTRLNVIRPAKVGEPQRVSLSNAVLVFEVTERKVNTLYDMAIVSNEIHFSSDTEDATYNNFSQYISSCANADELETKAPQAGYQLQEQKNLLSTAYTIGANAPLANTRDAVKWAFAKANEGSISEIFRDPAEGRFLAVVVTKINPKGYLDIKAAEPTLRAEVLKDKKADMLVKKLAGAKTLEEAIANGAVADTLHSTTFPKSVAVLHLNEPGLSGAIAATAEGQTVKAPFKGENGVYLFKVLSRSTDSEKTFERRNEELNQMKNLLWLVTPSQYNRSTNVMDVLVEKADMVDNRYLF